MQKCTACKKAVPTIHVLDLEHGSVVKNTHLCEACAEANGVVAGKASLYSTLETLLGGMHGQVAGAAARAGGSSAACPACHLTVQEFETRGRLGCPRCYDAFKAVLLPLLERVHDGTAHRGRYPGHVAKPASRLASLSELRTRLDEAVAAERYEEAASLRDQLKQAGETGDADEPSHGAG